VFIELAHCLVMNVECFNFVIGCVIETTFTKDIGIPLFHMKANIQDIEEYIGMWVTADGYIRHELLPGNRYHEARGNRRNAYRGSYSVTDNHIDYKDDPGFTADGDFKDGILYHAGMVLYKEKDL
jgi:hypothetical protein